MISTTEKTIIHTVEITKIIPANNPNSLWPVEEMNRLIAQYIMDALGCDHVNVVKCQIFEMEEHHEQS